MKEIKRFWRWLIFPLQYKVQMLMLRRIDHWFSYPILIYLTFERKKIRDKFINGKSMRDIIMSKVNIQIAAVKRHSIGLKARLDSEAYKRLKLYNERKENQRSIEEYFGVKF